MFPLIFAFLVKTATTTQYYPVELPATATEEQKLDDTLQSLSSFYDLSYQKLHDVIYCESRWNLQAYNPHDVTGRAVGLMQFHDDLFYEYAEKLGIDTPDIFNAYQQIEVGLYLWSIGQQNRWSCAKMV